MSAKIIDGKMIAEIIKKDISKKIKDLEKEYKKTPNISTIKAGNNPSSEIYIKLRNKGCKQVGINTNTIDFPENITEDELIAAIKKLNNDCNVHGILIQLPLPKHINQDKIINLIDPKKDVEGLTPKNMGSTLNGDEKIIPITPLSVLTIIENQGIEVKGKDIVIINHSNHVGKPLAALLLNRNASLSVCHVFTKDLKFYTKNADIIITAAGVKNLITKDHIKKGCFLIDVAIISTKEGIFGDVDFNSVKDIAGIITPVPGGVGPVTVACSLKNMIKTFKNCNS